jgi:hypothetical protein
LLVSNQSVNQNYIIMKKLILLISGIVLSWSAFSQVTALYSDDFESYNVGDYMAESNPTWWTTWGNAPGTGEDGYISDNFANSPTKALFIDPSDGQTDQILKLGNKTSGAYDVNWMIYVEAGYQAYYNFQHFQSPGIEWAFEVWYYSTGSGKLLVGGTEYTFTFPAGTWFLVEHSINIDDDLASLTVNGTVVHTWPFSYEGGAPGGTNQLGGVDFWTDDNTYRYYVDDLTYNQLAASQDPVMVLTPEQLGATSPQGYTTALPLTISNEGVADLNYSISVIYPFPAPQTTSATLEATSAPTRSLGYQSEVSLDPNARPASYNPPPTDDFVLNYDGDNFSAIGWASAPISPTAAAMFPTNLTLPHAGLMLTSVDVYINDPGTNYILKVYDMGNSYEPGALLVSQPFAGQSLSWNSITLDNPVYITGADIWVGYQFTQPAIELFIPGTDGGPANPNGDFISTGVGWSHLSDNPELNYNWNIRANLTGTPIEQWLSVAPAAGTVTPGNSVPITVTFDASNLDLGTYTATLRVVSNDPENLQFDVPVTFEVTEGGTMNSVVLDFEAQEDFSLTFDPWTAVDNDGADTYGFDGVDFPHTYEPMAFIAFNPASTVPAMSDDPEIQPHGGARFGACMASVPSPFNDDWMISPQTALGLNSSITMWVKSYTDEYGLEKYNVLVSTTDMNPASFTSISGSTPMLAPMAWTEVTFDLSQYDGQTVYVAIQCVSEDAWVFMLDDVSIDFIVGTPENEQETSVSLYPNPVYNQLNINSGSEITEVKIFNQLGQIVYSQTLKETSFSLNTTGFNSGVYFVRIITGQGITTEKIIIR